MEKDRILQSKKFREIKLYIGDFNGKQAAYHLQVFDADEEVIDDEPVYIEDDEYMYELYKVLREANEMGVFKEFEKNNDNEAKNIILI